jgi:hypothetical protein
MKIITLLSLVAMVNAFGCSASEQEVTPARSVVQRPRDAGESSDDASLHDSGVTDDAATRDVPFNPIVTQECAPSNNENVCHRCEDEHCCDTYAAYSENPQAIALKECTSGCYSRGLDAPTEAACVLECVDRSPQGVAVFAPRLMCMTLNCREECGAGPQSECMQCTYTNCASEWADSGGNEQGYLWGICNSGCDGDLQCAKDCFLKYPEAEATQLGLWECTSAFCPMCLQTN